MAALVKFRYRGVTADGRKVSDDIAAANRQEALRRLEADGIVVTQLDEQRDAPAQQRSAFGARKMNTEQRIVLLRQLALMTRAGVDLLESVETVAQGMGGDAAVRLRGIAQALRRGDRLSEAMRAQFPGLPNYVYSLLAAGEASGRLDQVLEDAARQLAFEDRVRRDIGSALTYPLFLIIAGTAAIGFLFYEIVPRFADMIGTDPANLDGLSRIVIESGLTFRGNAVLILTVIAIVGGSTAAFAVTEAGKRAIYGAAMRIPGLGAILKAREQSTWARIMHFSLANGVGILDATALSASSLPQGRFRSGLASVTRSIRSGKKIDEAFAEANLLSSLDRSLLKAGQRSGALPAMLGYIAERHEEALKDAIKRGTALVEPAAIGIVAMTIGVVAIGLVTAMSSVYDSVL